MATKFEDWSGHATAVGIPTGYTAMLDAFDGSVQILEEASYPGGKYLSFDNVGGGKFVIAPDDIAATGDQQVFTLSLKTSSASSDHFPGSVARASTSANTYYQSSLVFITVGSDERFRTNRLLDGAFANISSTTIANLATNTIFATLLEVVGTTVRAKYWIPANPSDPKADEPASWTLSATNSEIASGKAAIGVRQGGGRLIVAGFGTDGDSAPMSAAGGLDVPANFTFAKVLDTRQIDAAADPVTDANSYELEWEEWDGSVFQPMGIETNATPSFTLTDVDGVNWNTLYRGRMRAMP